MIILVVKLAQQKQCDSYATCLFHYMQSKSFVEIKCIVCVTEVTSKFAIET